MCTYQISGIHVQSWHSGSLLSSWSKYLPSSRSNGNFQSGNISWNYIYHHISYHVSRCRLYCFTSSNEFLWYKCLKATCERIAYNFLCKGKPCLRQEIDYAVPIFRKSDLRLVGMSHYQFFLLECHSKSCANWTSCTLRMELNVPEVSLEHTFADALPCILQRNSVMLCIDLFVLIHFVEGSLSKRTWFRKLRGNLQRHRHKRKNNMKLSAGNSEQTATNTDTEETTKPAF